MRTRAWAVPREKLCSLQYDVHRPTELLGCTTLFLLLNAKKLRLWLKATHCSVSKTLTVTDCCEEERNAWRPEACLGALPFTLLRACLWKAMRFFCLFAFNFIFLKRKKKEKEVKFKKKNSSLGAGYVNWDSCPLVLCSCWSKHWNLHYRRSPGQVWYVSFPTLAFRAAIRLEAISEGGKERKQSVYPGLCEIAVNLWHDARLAGSTCWLEGKTHSPR